MAKDDVAGFGKCPFVTSQKLLQGKWSILIMHYLSEGTLRFGELQLPPPPALRLHHGGALLGVGLVLHAECDVVDLVAEARAGMHSMPRRTASSNSSSVTSNMRAFALSFRKTVSSL